jgi:hypothetical protein
VLDEYQYPYVVQEKLIMNKQKNIFNDQFTEATNLKGKRKISQVLGSIDEEKCHIKFKVDHALIGES